MDSRPKHESVFGNDDFRLLVNAVTDYAIYMLDAHGHVASWNAGAQRFKGYTASEIVGQHFSRFYLDEDRAAGVPEKALRTAASEGKFEAEGWRVRKDGSRFWAHVVIDPIRTPSGEVIGYAKITRDLTERRAAQDRLDRTREQLFQAQKMESLGQLTGGVAHDFNNILAAILGSLELARRRVDAGADSRLALLLDNATQAALRGATLTQRMLSFARRQDLRPEAVDMKRLVDGMSDMLERTLDVPANLMVHFPVDLAAVLVDPGQLEMALLNLAVNARDSMPHGGPITISARDQMLAEDNALGLPGGRYVAVSVADRGEGMDEATQARAIEPFFTTKGVGKGTGLGLPMVQGLAAQSGGRLQLESIVGTGTTATLWLPAAAAAAQRVAAKPAEAPAVATVRALRILAVDDDALVLMNTEAMLEDLGHQVVIAYSGAQALDRLRGGPGFDLLITDQSMPGMTGAALIEVAGREWPGMKVMLATGYAELPAGTATGVPRLAKPFMQAELEGALRALGAGAA
jgi:PAS domain S-box-containing protein